MYQLHTFQPFQLEDLDFNIFTTLKKDWSTVTTEAAGKTNTMTASWGGIGRLWDRDVVSIYIRESRFTREMLDKSEFFSLNFFDMSKKENKMALKIFGSVSGRDEDKIAEAHFHVNHKKNIPFLDESNHVFLCHKIARSLIEEKDILDPGLLKKQYPEGDLHYMYVGEIMEVMAR